MDSHLKLKAKKRNLFADSSYSKPENKITEAFIKMLEKSKPNITSCLLEHLGLGKNTGNFQYELQVKEDIQKITPKPYVLGIADNKEPIQNSDEKEEGDPDAYIYTRDDSVHILIEVKLNLNRLLQDQLERHGKRFKQIPEEDILYVNKSWVEIRKSLSLILSGYNESDRNYLLISEFLDLISPKGHYDIYEYPQNEQYRELFLYLDKYIQDLPGVSVDKIRKDDSIDFEYKGSNFVSVWPKKGEVILKPREQEMQTIVNQMLNQEHYDFQLRKVEKLKGEGIIRLDLVNDISMVKEFIRITYNVRRLKEKK